MQVGIFGKHSEHADFVRVGASSPAAQWFQGWLHRNVESLRKHGTEWSQGSVNFVIDAGADYKCVVGVMRPSRDSVGRSFPLAVFAEQEEALSSVPYSCLPALWSNWLDQVSCVLRDGEHPSVEGMAAAMREPDLHPADAARAWTACRSACLESSAAFAARLFEGAEDGQHYAFQTFSSACAATRSGPPPTCRVTLECPVRSQSDVLAWLEGSRLLLGWPRRIPCFLWNTQERLLIALGPAPDSALVFLAQPDYGGHSFWPLRTQSEEARQRASADLPPALKAALHEGSSLEHLFQQAVER